MELSTTKDVSTSILVEKYIYQGFLLMVNPITIAVSEIKCLVETSEASASDEPYVLVVAADLQSVIPNVEAVLYGPWDDVDAGETARTFGPVVPPGFDWDLYDFLPYVIRKPFWGLNRQPTVINNPAQVMFLVAMMGNDDGKPKAARGLVKGAAVASLASSTNATRADRIKSLIQDIESAVLIPTGAPNFDDPIDKVKELQLTSQDLSLASAGVHTKTLQFTGDGGKYNVVFELKKG